VGDWAAGLLITLGARSACEKLPKGLPNGQGVAGNQSSSSASETVSDLTI